MPVTISGSGLASGVTSVPNLQSFPIGPRLANVNMPVGSVLQVVSATYSTSTSTSSNSYTDTGLTATITPSSATSKILIFINHTENYKTAGNSNNNLVLNLVKNGVEITQFNNSLGFTGTASDLVFTASYSYLDSPATTSALTYKTQFRNSLATGAITVQQNSKPSTITLMEIAG